MSKLIITNFFCTEDEEEKKEEALPIICKLGSICHIQDTYHKQYYIHYMIDQDAIKPC